MRSDEGLMDCGLAWMGIGVVGRMKVRVWVGVGGWEYWLFLGVALFTFLHRVMEEGGRMFYKVLLFRGINLI